MPSRANKKHDVLTALFNLCIERGNFVIDRDDVSRACNEFGFVNKFDSTKVDHSHIYPEVMRQGRGYFLVHLGKGRHQFVPNMSLGYHKLEPIDARERQDWTYRPSLLNEVDKSESNILSVAFNQRILHDFLYNSVGVNPSLYLPRRTYYTGNYTISGQVIRCASLMMEMDAVVEFENEVTIIEAKNDFPDDFAIGQLFHPYLKHDDLRRDEGLDIKRIQCCYMQRDKRTKRARNSILRFHLYRFSDREMTSIQLVRKAEYRLIRTEAPL